MKKLISLLLALSLCMSLTVTAFAKGTSDTASETCTVTADTNLVSSSRIANAQSLADTIKNDGLKDTTGVFVYRDFQTIEVADGSSATFEIKYIYYPTFNIITIHIDSDETALGFTFDVTYRLDDGTISDVVMSNTAMYISLASTTVPMSSYTVDTALEWSIVASSGHIEDIEEADADGSLTDMLNQFCAVCFGTLSMSINDMTGMNLADLGFDAFQDSTYKTHTHDWQFSYVEKSASETEDGTAVYTCSVCGDTKEVTVPAHSHVWDEGTDGALAGQTDYTCAVCGEVKTVDVSAKFTDVNSDDWFVPYVSRAYAYGLMSGISDSEFGPYETTSRAMVVQILYAMAGRPSVEGQTCPFADVPAGEWYYKAIVWAYNNNVTKGTGPDTFSPKAAVTRQELAVLLYAYVNRPTVNGDLSTFGDADSVASWAYNALVWATQNGIMKGDQNHCLNPESNASRAEAATMMVQFYKYVQQNG